MKRHDSIRSARVLDTPWNYEEGEKKTEKLFTLSIKDTKVWIYYPRSERRKQTNQKERLRIYLHLIVQFITRQERLLEESVNFRIWEKKGFFAFLWPIQSSFSDLFKVGRGRSEPREIGIISDEVWLFHYHVRTAYEAKTEIFSVSKSSVSVSRGDWSALMRDPNSIPVE